MTSRDFIKKAQQIQAGSNNHSVLAIEEYKKAIDAAKSKDDEYELLYAHYQVMWIYSHIDGEQAVPFAQKCLELLKPAIEAGAIMHFTEMGQFQKEVIRYASNTIGWYSFSKTDDANELERILSLVSMGCEDADSPEYFYIFDTKVRILFKLGRKEEAYRIVRSCLVKDKYFSGFDDIKLDKDYQEWKSNFEAGIVTEFTEEEKIFLDKAARITEKIKLQSTNGIAGENDFKESTMHKEIITFEEAKEKYGVQHYHENHDSVLLITGDIYVTGDLNDAWFNKQLEGMAWKTTLYGMIIVGDLTVAGSIIDDNYLELFVTGNLICDNVFSYDGMIRIKGDSSVKYGIYGEYNDGSLDIYGTLNTPYIIAYDHSMPKESAGDFIYIEVNGNSRESIAIAGLNYHEDAQKLLSALVWDDNDEFSVNNFFEIVRKGGNPFIQLK